MRNQDDRLIWEGAEIGKYTVPGTFNTEFWQVEEEWITGHGEAPEPAWDDLNLYWEGKQRRFFTEKQLGDIKDTINYPSGANVVDTTDYVAVEVGTPVTKQPTIGGHWVIQFDKIGIKYGAPGDEVRIHKGYKTSSDDYLNEYIDWDEIKHSKVNIKDI